MPGAKAGTVWNSPQPGHSRSCGSVAGGLAEDRFTGPTSIDARPSASWPTAVLIAVTSPWMPGCRRRHDKTETAQHRPGPPLEADAGLGLQDDVAGRVLVEPLHVQLDGRVRRGRDGAGLADHRALRQALAQFLGQHAAQHCATAARPTSRST